MFRGMAVMSLVSALAQHYACALPATEVFEVAAESSVVIIVDEGKRGKQVQGSGVVVAESVVATNCHLFADHQDHAIAVLFSGRQYPATILESRRAVDICVLSVPAIRTRVAVIVPMDKLKIGQRVYAVGAPLGLDLTFTEGLISGIRRTNDRRVLQTSAPISPGSSGGGLFDEDGRLVGITTFFLQGGNQLNFAVPADIITPILAVRKSPFGDYPAPHLVFATDAEGWAWLADMSSRLASKMPDWPTRRNFLVTVQYEATRSGVDPQLVLALIEVASDFRKYAVSSTGARGFMQIAPRWIKQIGSPAHDLFTLRTNVRYGCTILRYYIDQTSDLDLALERYAEGNDLHPATDAALKPSDFNTQVLTALARHWRLAK